MGEYGVKTKGISVCQQGFEAQSLDLGPRKFDELRENGTNADFLERCCSGKQLWVVGVLSFRTLG